MTTTARTVPWAQVPDPGCCLVGCASTHIEEGGISEWLYWGARNCLVTVLDNPQAKVQVTRNVGLGPDDNTHVTTHDAIVYCSSSEDDLSPDQARELAAALVEAARLVDGINEAAAEGTSA